jgi:hypothetical protein
VATQTTNPKAFSIRGDKAIRFVPYLPSKEEDAHLLVVAVEAQTPAVRMEKALNFLRLAADQPDLLFYPTPWSDQVLLTLAPPQPVTATPAAQEEEEEEENEPLEPEEEE